MFSSHRFPTVTLSGELHCCSLLVVCCSLQSETGCPQSTAQCSVLLSLHRVYNARVVIVWEWVCADIHRVGLFRYTQGLGEGGGQLRVIGLRWNLVIHPDSRFQKSKNHIVEQCSINSLLPSLGASWTRKGGFARRCKLLFVPIEIEGL